jgi:phage terminase small subunit
MRVRTEGGGYRPGGGRPKKAKPIAPDIVRAATASKMEPLEYMLAVMNDVTADETRRDRMAIAAAPYCHPRVADQRLSKREQQGDAAETAGIGTPWAADLGLDIHAN